MNTAALEKPQTPIAKELENVFNCLKKSLAHSDQANTAWSRCQLQILFRDRVMHYNSLDRPFLESLKRRIQQLPSHELKIISLVEGILANIQEPQSCNYYGDIFRSIIHYITLGGYNWRQLSLVNKSINRIVNEPMFLARLLGHGEIKTTTFNFTSRLKKSGQFVRALNIHGKVLGGLNLDSTKGFTTELFEEILELCPNIQSISLQYITLKKNHALALAERSGLHSLEIVCGSYEDEALTVLKDCTNLRELRFISNYMTNHLEVAAFTHLDTLVVKTLSITDEDLLDILKSCTNLTSLEISRHKLGDPIVQSLCRITNIRSLCLQHCYMDSYQSLVELGKLSNLTSLDLGGLLLNDWDLRGLSKHPRLANLSLGMCTNISDSTVNLLESCTRLKTLNIFKCKKINSGSLQRLIKSVTNLQFLTLSKQTTGIDKLEELVENENFRKQIKLTIQN